MNSTVIVLVLIGLAAGSYVFLKIRKSIKNADCGSCCSGCKKECSQK